MFNTALNAIATFVNRLDRYFVPKAACQTITGRGGQRLASIPVFVLPKKS